MKPELKKKEITPLSTAELARFDDLHRVVENENDREGEASLLAAKAVHIIKKEQLYREKFESIQSYGESVGHEKSRTYRLVRSGEICELLDEHCRQNGLSLPKREWQLRPFHRCRDNAAICTAWANAVAESGTLDPSAKQVEKCLQFLLGTTAPATIKRGSLEDHIASFPGIIERFVEEKDRLGFSTNDLVVVALADYLGIDIEDERDKAEAEAEAANTSEPDAAEEAVPNRCENFTLISPSSPASRN